MFGLTYLQFNFLEGLFWVVLASVCLFIAHRFRNSVYVKLAWFSATTLLLFGISDFVELATDENFLYPTHWLFLWKGACLVAMVFGVIWYLSLRLKKS